MCSVVDTAQTVIQQVLARGDVKVLVHVLFPDRPDCLPGVLNLRTQQGQERLEWVTGIVEGALRELRQTVELQHLTRATFEQTLRTEMRLLKL